MFQGENGADPENENIEYVWHVLWDMDMMNIMAQFFKIGLTNKITHDTKQSKYALFKNSQDVRTVEMRPEKKNVRR